MKSDGGEGVTDTVIDRIIKRAEDGLVVFIQRYMKLVAPSSSQV